MKKLVEIPRATIEELALRYQLEPTMRDVFVEGQYDQTIISWFIGQCCANKSVIAVTQIDEVNIPVELLKRHGLTTGNRSEVIALCLELQDRLGPSLPSATGIVDLDTSLILGNDPECAFLLKSDFSCIEMYLFSDNCLQKTLELVFPKVKLSAENVLKLLSPILLNLFLARAANQSLKFSTEWIPFDSFVIAKNGTIELRISDFFRHYLQHGGVWERRDEFEAEILKLRARIRGDFRFSSNGHDAICLLSHFLKTFYRKTDDKTRTIPELLIYLMTCSLEVTKLKEMPMFKSLLNRMIAA